MVSQIPIHLERIAKKDQDRETVRAGIIAERDAINLYEQMAALANNRIIKKVLLDIAREEKAHGGAFQALLVKQDPEQKQELAEGEKEVDELARGVAPVPREEP